MEPEESRDTQFAFLIDAAKELGAADAKVIAASDVIVEDRVTLKCRAGCIGYGEKTDLPAACPDTGRIPENSFRVPVRPARQIHLARTGRSGRDLFDLPVLA
jgi:predicted metal-binding protein